VAFCPALLFAVILAVVTMVVKSEGPSKYAWIPLYGAMYGIARVILARDPDRFVHLGMVLYGPSILVTLYLLRLAKWLPTLDLEPDTLPWS
jgi:hypothetical protein